LLDQSGIGQIGRNAGIGQAPYIRHPVRRTLVDGEFHAGLQVQADGKE
jgi:hypothetical protein